VTRERFEERKGDVRNAAARLREVADTPLNEIVRDATIQRFEFTFEVIWKTLKFYLEREGLEVASPRQTIKQAFSEGLIPTEDEADTWFMMLEDRNRTSHVYREEVAQEIYDRVVARYVPLLTCMAESIQGLRWD
jgi:nucleotidyltransferase substrate binding protein (TIGR01987 family)